MKKFILIFLTVLLSVSAHAAPPFPVDGLISNGDVNITGDLTFDNATATGRISASFYYGNGSNLTGIVSGGESLAQTMAVGATASADLDMKSYDVFGVATMTTSGPIYAGGGVIVGPYDIGLPGPVALLQAGGGGEVGILQITRGDDVSVLYAEPDSVTFFESGTEQDVNMYADLSVSGTVMSDTSVGASVSATGTCDADHRGQMQLLEIGDAGESDSDALYICGSSGNATYSWATVTITF